MTRTVINEINHPIIFINLGEKLRHWRILCWMNQHTPPNMGAKISMKMEEKSILASVA